MVGARPEAASDHRHSIVGRGESAKAGMPHANVGTPWRCARAAERAATRDERDAGHHGEGEPTL